MEDNYRTTYRRSKKQPPKGTRCDTATADYSGRHPTLKRCPNAATVELLGGFCGEVWVCEDCAGTILQRPAHKSREGE